MKRLKLILSVCVLFSLLSCSKISFFDKKEDTPKTETKTDANKTEPEKSKEIKSTGESITFMDKKISFGSSPSDFLSSFSDYKLCPDESGYEKVKTYCKLIESTDANGNMTNFKTYFSFYNDELFQMSISERWSAEKYMEIIEKVTKQFKPGNKESNENENGWFKEELTKGNLKGNYGGDGDGTMFLCYDTDIMKKVKQIYPGYNED